MAVTIHNGINEEYGTYYHDERGFVPNVGCPAKVSDQIKKEMCNKAPLTGKIGIGLTTHNRAVTFAKTFMHLTCYLPKGVNIAVVDDASEIDYVDEVLSSQKVVAPLSVLHYRFERNVGIAKSKNKCLELLYDSGCEHIFLFDDDTYPLVDEWWVTYINSGEPHLMYIFQHFANAKGPNDMIEIFRDDKIAAYSHVRGCMLYYHRKCLDAVGGMDIVFGKWGHEHGDLSNRIYAAGLTRFRYMDAAGSKGLFYAADEQEHGKFQSTVPGGQRVTMLDQTRAIYQAQKDKPLYREFRSAPDTGVGDKVPLFLTAYFTTLGDPQRGGDKWQTNPVAISAYILSIGQKMDKSGLTVVLNDNQINDSHNKENGLHFVKIPVSGNPYFQRWMSYYEYLIRHQHEVSWVFMTDCTDVELLNWPSPVPSKIYVGDEPGTIGANRWLSEHHRDPELSRFFKASARDQIVNAGILGGYLPDVLPFIRGIIDTYTLMQHNMSMGRSAGPGMTDMGIFNYVAYTMFRDKIVHGRQVNTVFKANERSETSWWKHK
jgi:hypothetical protein